MDFAIKLKEKNNQYKIAIVVFIIMFVIKIVALYFWTVENYNIFFSAIDIIAGFSFSFIFALMFRDIFYKNKYEDIIFSSSFINAKNKIFIITLIVCIIYLIMKQIKDPEIISDALGVVFAGLIIQQLNLEIRKDSVFWKKLLACTFLSLVSGAILIGSFLELFLG